MIVVPLPDFIACCHFPNLVKLKGEDLERVGEDKPDPLLLAINDLIDGVNKDIPLDISMMWSRLEILYDNIDAFKVNIHLIQIMIIQLSRKGDNALSERVKRQVKFPGFLF